MRRTNKGLPPRQKLSYFICHITVLYTRHVCVCVCVCGKISSLRSRVEFMRTAHYIIYCNSRRLCIPILYSYTLHNIIICAYTDTRAQTRFNIRYVCAYSTLRRGLKCASVTNNCDFEISSARRLYIIQ